MVQGSPAMKFYCEQCNTKYSIAEEKVRGKVLKVRCKSCGNIITVRDPEAPTPAAQALSGSERPEPPQPPGASPRVPQTNWYYSINGQSSAAMELDVLKARYESGELGDESYVWHESIIEWKPVRSVAIFENALAKGQAIRPRAKTIGFTGALEAIKVTDAPKGKQAGAAPTAREPVAAQPAAQTAPVESTPVEKPAVAQKTLEAPKLPEIRPKSITPAPKIEQPEPREDRLERLREKLRNDVPNASTSLPSLTAPAAKKPQVDVVPIPFDVPVADSPTVPAVAANPAPGLPAKLELPSFNPQPITSSTSNVFDAISDSDDDSSDSGLIPFFPDAPKLESSMQTAKANGQDVSASLLIRIDEMQGQNRKQKHRFIISAVVAVVVIGGLVVFAMNRPEPAPAPLEQTAKATVRVPVEKSYSKEKLNAFAMELGEEVIGPDEKAEDLAAMEVAAAQPTEPVKVIKPAETKPEVAPKKEPAAVIAKRPPEVAKPVENAQPTLTGREALLTYSPSLRDSAGEIKRPEDQLVAAAVRPKTLSKEEARKGFKSIRQSISVCRERHMRRGATFAANKIIVAITVQPAGRVSSYKLDPPGIRLTEFDTCMTSHMDRWKFAAWDGVETEINSSFVIQ